MSEMVIRPDHLTLQKGFLLRPAVTATLGPQPVHPQYCVVNQNFRASEMVRNLHSLRKVGSLFTDTVCHIQDNFARL